MINKETFLQGTACSKSWAWDLLGLFIFISSLYWICLGSRPLFIPEEGRYAEIAREMFASWDYITPHLNGIKYFEKPILYYWLELAAIKIAGLNLWSLRSVNASFGLLCCLETYLVIRVLYDRVTGLYAAIILSTSLLFFVMGHMISLDMSLCFFLCTCLFSLLLALQPEDIYRRWFIYVASIAAALAVLTKGLIGIVFPGMILFSWLCIFRQWRLLSTLHIPSALCIFLALTLPWHVLVQIKNPEFFNFYFIQQHFLRYTTLQIGHYQPAWFFIPNLILGFFPWIFLLPATLFFISNPRHFEKTRYQNNLFFLFWASLIFLFFSFSHSKLIHYILPIFPPLAVLTAIYGRQLIQLNKLKTLRFYWLLIILSSGGIFLVFKQFLAQTEVPDVTQATLLLYAAVGILSAATLISFVIMRRHLYASLCLLSLGIWGFLLLLMAAIPSIDSRSTKDLAATLIPILKPQDKVITYNQYFQDLPFYLNRTVSILNWRNELRFGMQFQPTPDLLDDKSFYTLWASEKNVYMVIDRTEYAKFRSIYPHFSSYVMTSTVHNLLVSNHFIKIKTA